MSKYLSSIVVNNGSVTGLTFQFISYADLPLSGASPGSYANATVQVNDRGIVTNIAAGSAGAGSGSVTSVDIAVPTGFTVSGSPITTSGTITIGLSNETANFVWAGPTTGAAATPTFRALVAADISGIVVASFGSETANTVFAGPTSGAAAAPTFRSVIGADMVFDSSDNLFVGGGGLSVSGSDNVAIGAGSIVNSQTSGALNAILAGSGNVAIGASVLSSVTSGSNNLAMGDSAGLKINSGARNIAFGNQALDSLLSSSDNIAIGSQAMGGQISNSFGFPSIGIGTNALLASTTGTANVGIGYHAGISLINGAGNTFVGYLANTSKSNCNFSIAIGYESVVPNSNQCVIGGDGTNIFSVSLIWAGSTAPLDADLATTQASAFWDFTAGASKLRIKGKDSAGTVFVTECPNLRGYSSTSTDRPRANLDTSWVDSTDATRKARVILSAWDTAAREVMRGEGTGTAAAVGFLGANAAVQQTGDAGTALVTFGLMSGTPTFSAGNLTNTDSGLEVDAATGKLLAVGGTVFIQSAINLDIVANTEIVVHDNDYELPSGDLAILESGSLLDVRQTQNLVTDDRRPGTSYTIPDMGSVIMTGLLILDSGILVEIAAPAASDSDGGILNLI